MGQIRSTSEQRKAVPPLRAMEMVLHLSQMLDRVEPKSSRSETLRLTVTQFAVEQFVLFFK